MAATAMHKEEGEEEGKATVFLNWHIYSSNATDIYT